MGTNTAEPPPRKVIAGVAHTKRSGKMEGYAPAEVSPFLYLDALETLAYDTLADDLKQKANG